MTTSKCLEKFQEGECILDATYGNVASHLAFKVYIHSHMHVTIKLFSHIHLKPYSFKKHGKEWYKTWKWWVQFYVMFESVHNCNCGGTIPFPICGAFPLVNAFYISKSPLTNSWESFKQFTKISRVY